MKSALEILYDKVYWENPSFFEKDPLFISERANLRQELTGQQQNLLIQMQDRMCVLAEEKCALFFREGLRLGLSLAQLNQEEETEI